MLILKCTQKVAKEFDVKRADLPQISALDNMALLGDWFVNSLRFGHVKILLFANAETLYSFLVRYRKKDLADIGQLFRTNLRLHLLAENFRGQDIDRVLSGYQEVRLAKTDSRSVLGSMNDLVWMYKHWLVSEADKEPGNLVQIVRKINRTPQLQRGGEYSINLFRKRIEL